MIRCEKTPTAVPSKRRPTYATTLPVLGVTFFTGVVKMMSPGLIVGIIEPVSTTRALTVPEKESTEKVIKTIARA